MSHTPGPWIVKKAPSEFGDFLIDSKTCYHVAITVGGLNDGVEEANAEIISRATEMYAEIEQLKEQRDELLEALNEAKGWNWFDEENIPCVVVEKINAAIAKATSK